MINNQTILNTSLYTFLSSGAVDVIMAEEHSINNRPLPINLEKKEKISIGDRFTIFLDELFTNSFLINLEMLGQHKTVFINFRTTKEYSFSLKKDGHKNFPYEVIFGKGTEKWGKGTVRNLEQYFEGYPEDQVLSFGVMIHKSNSYRYFVELEVKPDSNYRVLYLPNGGKNTYVNKGTNVTFADLKTTKMKPRGRSLLKEGNTKPDGTGTTYLPGNSITLTEDLVVFAIWEHSVSVTDLEIIAYDITTDSIIAPNHHTTEVRDSKGYIPDGDSWGDINLFKDYTFNNCTKNISGGDIYKIGDEISIHGEAMQLYYVFSKKPVKTFFEFVYVDRTDQRIIDIVQQPVTIDSEGYYTFTQAPTYVGYVFAGYADNAVGAGMKQPGDKYYIGTPGGKYTMYGFYDQT